MIDAYLGAHHDVDIGAMSDEFRPADDLGRLESSDELSTPDHGVAEACAMITNIVECEALVAGYVPGVNILNGCDLTVAQGEFVGHHRAERRRQVDADEGGARPRLDPIRGAFASTGETSPVSRLTASCSAVSGSSLRRTTSSRLSRCGRTSRWGAS